MSSSSIVPPTAANASRPAAEARPKWCVVVNDQLVPMPHQIVPATVIRKQAGVPDAHVLFRDNNSSNDSVIPLNAQVDLANGNVFRSSEACGASSAAPSGAPKFAISLDDRWEIVVVADQTGRSIRELFGLPATVELLRDHESPFDEPIDDDERCVISTGPVFRSEKHCSVTVVVNNKKVVFTHRRVTGLEIKQTATKQGVNLCADCVLHRVKPGGGFGSAIRDHERVVLHEGDEFRCITPDDNS
jgi:hypothetical protein